MTYITPEDITARLLRRHPFWFHGEPKIELIGEEHTFGILKFDFEDEIVSYRIYIRDRNEILAAAQSFVENYLQLSSQHYDLYDEKRSCGGWIGAG